MKQAMIIKLLKQNRPYLVTHFGIQNLYLFGSFAYGVPQKNSDIDLLIEVPKPQKTYQNYRSAKMFLENVFHRPVDLVYSDSANPVILQNILDRGIYIE